MSTKSEVNNGKVPLIHPKPAVSASRKPQALANAANRAASRTANATPLDYRGRPAPFNFTLKDGRTVRVERLSGAHSARAFQRFINDLVRSKALILGDRPMTLTEEREWLSRQFDSIRNDELVRWVAVGPKGQIAANMEATRGRFRDRDVVSLGVSVHPDYQGQGLGEAVLRTTIADALSTFKPRILYLNYVGSNQRAQNLYRKVGFRETSRRRRWHKFGNRLEDEVTMVYQHP